MTENDKQRFCRQVLESLSDIIEGEAPEDFCHQVDQVLGECQPFLAFRATFEETMRLTHNLGDRDTLPELDEDGFQRCVEKVRRQLEPGSKS